MDRLTCAVTSLVQNIEKVRIKAKERRTWVTYLFANVVYKAISSATGEIYHFASAHEYEMMDYQRHLVAPEISGTANRLETAVLRLFDTSHWCVPLSSGVDGVIWDGDSMERVA